MSVLCFLFVTNREVRRLFATNASEAARHGSAILHRVFTHAFSFVLNDRRCSLAYGLYAAALRDGDYLQQDNPTPAQSVALLDAAVAVLRSLGHVIPAEQVTALAAGPLQLLRAERKELLQFSLGVWNLVRSSSWLLQRPAQLAEAFERNRRPLLFSATIA